MEYILMLIMIGNILVVFEYIRNQNGGNMTRYNNDRNANPGISMKEKHIMAGIRPWNA